MKGLKILSLLLIVAMLAIGCGAPATQPPPTQAVAQGTQAPQPTTPPPTPEGPRILKYAYTSGATTWDPSASFSTEAIYLCNMYETLLRINPPGMEPMYEPMLAASWDHSDDGLTWTFHLREGVKFQDGADLNADAVIKSISRTVELGQGAAFIWAPLDTMEAPDPMTVVFKLKYAAPLDLIASAGYGSWIISPKAIEAAASDPDYFQQASGIDAGTGPYKLESYTPDKEVVLTKFDGYWRGWGDVPHFDKVVVYIVADEVTRQQMLFGGEIDQASLLPIETLLRLKDDPDYRFYKVGSPYNYLAYLNTKKPPLDNKLVRQAIAYAMPYDDILQAGYYGYGSQSYSIVPKGFWPWSDKVFQYHYDLDKAKELLKQAGLEGKTFNLVMTYAAENPDEARFAPVIKDALEAIGFRTEIRPLMWAQQWELAKNDPATAQDILVSMYWPTYSDAGTDNLSTMLHTEEGYIYFNLAYWSNPEFDRMIEEAALLTATDREKAQDLYIQAMNLAADESPMLPFYDKEFIWVTPKTLAGGVYNTNYPGAIFFYEIYRP